MIDLKETQTKEVKLVIVPTWVTATLKERSLTYKDLMCPKIREEVFSKEELFALQLANLPYVATDILGEATRKQYGSLLYIFIVDEYETLEARARAQKYNVDDLLFGTQLPDDYHYEVSVDVLDDDDHVDVIVAIFARPNDDAISSSVQQRKNLEKVADALYVRNYTLADLTRLGLFQI